MSPNALTPAGPLSAEIAQLFWIFVAISAVVYVVVLGFLVFALRRGDGARAALPDSPAARRAVRAIGIAVGVTSVILVVLAVSDFLSNRVIAATPKDPLRVRVTAHQWWWEIEYVDADPTRRVRTANELHLPVGRPVLLEMTADDVIHSFWAPELNGKKDLLPGYTTTLTLVAARAGDYTAECAEFCGFQHANMRIAIVAHEPAEFGRWVDAQLAPAAEPVSPALLRGRDVFLGSTCVMCHNITGTDASAVVGPDLTHIASRRWIGAGALPNDPARLAAWISDPQAVKPGTRMPATRLATEDLDALTSYLASLQ
jgi:cytochrome c oxidase subunit II